MQDPLYIFTNRFSVLFSVSSCFVVEAFRRSSVHKFPAPLVSGFKGSNGPNGGSQYGLFANDGNGNPEVPLCEKVVDGSKKWWTAQCSTPKKFVEYTPNTSSVPTLKK